MIDEDLHTARRRARRWDELNESRTAISGLMRDARRELDASAGARLGAYTMVLATVERELAEVGPARELYEELLVRQERRMTGSADPRGAELLEIGRMLTELDVELPARERARAAGLAVLDGEGGREETVAAFVRDVGAVGMSVAPDVADGEVEGVVARLGERCVELGRLRDTLNARREELLLAG
ncbi:hypothetical protein HD597_008442 [Nonomuraea thailandensis]|uniref:Uncharacterized protein n=1 Tax=Nonomuraea thailandensis TaxID=1188745 RepID=A0A9X2GP95_9ACTN|nr:hypothetical protein [Nonomuraea thailandensis]MCP2361422.1 hypothetical protein [Nonomuraea thailandensis]